MATRIRERLMPSPIRELDPIALTHDQIAKGKFDGCMTPYLGTLLIQKADSKGFKTPNFDE